MAGSSGTTPRMRCLSCRQPRALLESRRASHSLPADSLSTARAGRPLWPVESSPGLVTEEMQAQRGEETCPRSPSRQLLTGTRIPTSAWFRAPNFMLPPGGGGTHSILLGRAYLKKLCGSQPAPSLGAAPGGSSSLERTPEGPTEGARCWGCCSIPPQRMCWTRCCCWGGAEGPGREHLQGGAQG